MKKPRYDDSLPLLVKFLSTKFAKEQLSKAAFVRDSSGRLSVVWPDHLTNRQAKDLDREIRANLQHYARTDGAIVTCDGPGADELLREARTTPPMNVGRYSIRLLDRRIVGADWLAAPAELAAKYPRVIFSSLKGGVGRSTALCVVAAHLSRRGRRVLAVDLDLEAPGIGTMLLKNEELPNYGVLDYLVENGISGIDSTFLTELGGDSYLGAEGARVTVVPAIGRKTIDHPYDALGKIARAYVEDVDNDGELLPLRAQLVEMIERLEGKGAYDIVLIDSRAGLHETTGATMLALGGDILLFGVDQPQTFLGYRLLLGHLARFPTIADDDWRDRLRFVHAKAPESISGRAAAEERFSELYDLIAPPHLDPQATTENLTADDFDMNWDQSISSATDQEFERPPVMYFLDDSRYREFNPLQNADSLSSESYSVTFKNLLDYADGIVEFEGLDSK